VARLESDLAANLYTRSEFQILLLDELILARKLGGLALSGHLLRAAHHLGVLSAHPVDDLVFSLPCTSFHSTSRVTHGH